MKKITSIVLATCMAGSLFAFSACGNGSVNGAVKGDYTEVTEENQEQVMQDITAFETNANKVNSGGLIGDTEKASWKFGASYATDLSMEYNLEGNANGKVSFNSNFAVAVSKSEGDFAVKGNGEVNASLKNTVKAEDGDSVTDAKVGAKAYVTDGWAYGELTSSGKIDNEAIAENWQSLAGKVSFTALSGLLDDYMGDFDMIDMGDYDSNVSISGLVATLQETGLPVSYELSEKSGLKLKVSITKEWVEAMMADASDDVSLAMSYIPGISGAPSVPAIPSMPDISEISDVTFDAFKLDFYVVISEKGLLKQVSVDMNINAKLVGATDSGKSYVKVKGSEVMKVDTAVKVVVPGNIAEDEKYTDYSLILGMMF